MTKATTPQQILDLLRVQFAEEVDYKRAQECCLRLLDGDTGKQRHSFQLLPAYKEVLLTTSPTAHIELLQDRHKGFQRVFICPSESRQSFASCRRLIAVDGTFLKARFILKEPRIIVLVSPTPPLGHSRDCRSQPAIQNLALDWKRQRWSMGITIFRKRVVVYYN